MDGTKLLKFANKLEDENKDKGYKWLYDKLRYQIIKDQNQAINYIRCCKSDSEQLSKRPNTSSTWECFSKADKQKKGNV